MDIRALHNISSNAIEGAAKKLGTLTPDNEKTAFSAIFDSAVNNITSTNNYLSAAENEEVKWALGESENTHDLTIALQKASTALQYTVAFRDKFVEAYRELMQLQI